MKPHPFTLLALALVASQAGATCFSVYDASGRLLYQGQDAPFDVSIGSAELAAQEALGRRLTMTGSDTCGGNDYRARHEAALRYVQSGQRAADQMSIHHLVGGGGTLSRTAASNPGDDAYARNREAAADLRQLMSSQRQHRDANRIVDAIDGLRHDLR